jgi:S1-C subfamily serine protease
MADHGLSLRSSASAGVVFAALVAVLALAACGGGSTKTVTTTVNASAPSGSTGTLQQQYVQVVQKVSPQVVQIRTSQGLGSGIVFDTNGDVVTNAHVVGNAKSFQITFADGKRHSATLVGTFPPDDLAVVRASGTNVKPATFADSSKLKVGDIVLAVGNPLGLRSSVTDGIVSALGRTVSEPGGGVLPSVIQTSAPINPGNSGGALVNLAGEVVGIPTLAATDPELGGSAAPGIGFAIPSNTASDIAKQIVEHGKVVNSHRAYLGVQVATGVTGSGEGAVVVGVQSGGPAAKAGIQQGDRIVSINGKPTSSADDVSTALATLSPGQAVPVEVVHRNGQKATLQVKLGQFPGS